MDPPRHRIAGQIAYGQVNVSRGTVTLSLPTHHSLASHQEGSVVDACFVPELCQVSPGIVGLLATAESIGPAATLPERRSKFLRAA